MVGVNYGINREQLFIYALVNSLVFLIFPLGAVFLSFLALLSISNRRLLVLFAIMLALYVSFVNVSKVISTDPDLTWYTEQYKDAGKQSFWEYIFWFGVNGKGRELFFPTYNYFVYFFVKDNVNLYRLILSMTTYGLAFFSIIRMSDFMKIKSKYVIIPLVWFACFPWIFTYSQTLLRQNLACSIFMWIMVERFFYGKKMIIPVICMVLTHTSSFVFLPFLYLNIFKKPIKGKNLALFLLIIAFFPLVREVAGFMLQFMGSSDNAVTYTLTRAAEYSNYKLEALTIPKIVYMIVFSFICIYIFYNTKARNRFLKLNSLKHVAFINTFAFFCAFILANYQQLAFSNRMFSYATNISVLSLLYVIKMLKPSNAFLWSYFFVMNIMLILYFTYAPGNYKYIISYGLLINPLQYII